MLRDRAGHNISYLRLSVTTDCNMACRYCMPQGPLPLTPSLEGRGMGEGDIVRVVRNLVAQGVTKVRLTGGEPLVRPDIISLIRTLAAIDGIETLAITTNGVYLAPMAHDLKSAGVSNVNIHIDSLRPAVHKWITGGDLLNETLKGISAACSAGFREVKLNAVLMRDVNDGEAEDMIAFASSLGISIRFIELMPIGAGAPLFEKHFLSVKNIIARLARRCELAPLEKRAGQGPARYFRIATSGAVVGFIGHRSMPSCSECNRIRVLSDGTVRKCLMKINGASMHAIGG